MTSEEAAHYYLMVKGPLLIKNILSVRKKVTKLIDTIVGVFLWRLQ